MLYMVVFIFLLLGMTVLILFTKVNILLEYLRNGWDDHIVLSFFAMGGLLKYKMEIPLLDIEKTGIRFKRIKEAGRKEKDKSKEAGFKKFFEMYDEFKAMKSYYRRHQVLICALKKYLRGRLILEEVELNVTVGAGDAYYTGIFGGLAWAMCGTAVSWMANHFTTFVKRIDVKTDYREKTLKIDLYCIFHIKIVHIIGVGFRISAGFLQGKMKHIISTGGGISG